MVLKFILLALCIFKCILFWATNSSCELCESTRPLSEWSKKLSKTPAWMLATLTRVCRVHKANHQLNFNQLSRNLAVIPSNFAPKNS